MKTTEAAQRVQEEYVAELRDALRTRDHRGMSKPQIRAMIGWGDRTAAAVHHADDSTTWVWSDLHLGEEGAVGIFDRPFGTVAEMDDALFGAWEKCVGANDTILCLGDAGIHQNGGGEDGSRWERAPGDKRIVVGNHDIDPKDSDDRIAGDGALLTLVAPGDPPLLFTHVPLLAIPAGCVNVHGHEHEAASPTTDRHINVCVEQLDYKPARLSDIRYLARRMLEDAGVPDHVTAIRIELAKRLLP